MTNGRRLALVDRGERHHRRGAHFGRHVAVGEQPADERPVRVRQRHDDAHLPRRRIGDRIDARDVAGELAVRIAVDREVHRRAQPNGRQLIRRHRRLEPHRRRIHDRVQRGARLHDVAGAHLARAHDAGERRRHRGLAQLLLRVRELRPWRSPPAPRAAEYWFCTSSRSRSAIAPALISASLRSTCRFAMSALFCAVVSAARAESSLSRKRRVVDAHEHRPLRHALALLGIRLQHRAADLGAHRRLLFRRERSRKRRARADLLRLHDRDVLRARRPFPTRSPALSSCRRAPLQRRRPNRERQRRAM